MKGWITCGFLFVVGVTILASQPVASQSRFSKEGAMAIIRTQDWNRLLAYGKAWAQAEPNNADAWFVIGRAYGSKYWNIGLGRPAEAAVAYQREVQLRPDYPEGWMALAITEQELGQWQASAVALQHATQLAPERTHYWDFLSASYIHLHQFQLAAQAVATLERYAKTEQDWFTAGNDYYAIAPYYEPTALYQKSKADFLRVLKLNPQNAEAWQNLGTTEQALGNYQAALDDYTKGARLGSKLGGSNYSNLMGDIKSCMNWRQRLNGSHPMALEVVNYNQHCSNITGQIKIVFVH